jgi:hypothetical protein
VVDQSATPIDTVDARYLADHEEYFRRELPKFFRHSLEKLVHEQTYDENFEFLCESILRDLIQDCQDQAFSFYRTKAIDSDPTEGHGEARLLKIGANVSVENDHRRRLEKISDKAHEASSNQNLRVVDKVSEVPNIDVSSTSGILNSEFRYLGNSHTWGGSSTEGESSCHKNNPEILLADFNATPTRDAIAVLTILTPQRAPESPKSGIDQSPHDSLQHLKKMTDSGCSVAPNQKNGSDVEDSDGPLDLGEAQQTIQKDQK